MSRSFRTVSISLIVSASAFVLAPRTLANPADAPATRPSSDEESKVKKVNLAEFEKVKAEKDAVVLDVRTPKEFAAGHVPGAVNIDWRARDFNDQVAKLDKSKKYVVHCLGGVRSAAATERMSGMNFAHLFDYSGGWSEYQKANKPVEK